MLHDHLRILGFKAVDKITGFEGIISSIGFDLYGCVQAVLTPSLNEKNEPREGRWFDTSRLKIIGKKPLMEIPSFDKIAPHKVAGGQQLPPK